MTMAVDIPPARYRFSSNRSGEAFALAMLATAGLFYVNIMPALVAGLIESLGLSAQEAGLVGSFNVYGAALGAIAIVPFVAKIPWRNSAIMMLCALTLLDVVSIIAQTADQLYLLRAIHGIIGGALVGLGFALIAKTKSPDKVFGTLLFVQFGLGGVVVWLAPKYVAEFGTIVLFGTLIAFYLVTAALIPFLGEPTGKIIKQQKSGDRINWQALTLILCGLFLFQAVNMGIYAYIIPLANDYGTDASMIGLSLGVAAWLGLIGAGIVMYLGDQLGRTRPMIAGVLFTVIGTLMLHWSESTALFFIGNAIVGITWALVIPYFLAMASQLDQTGQMAALGGFASKMGLASGPMMASFLVNDSHYTAILNIGAIGLVMSIIFVLKPMLQMDKEITLDQ